MKPFGIPRGVWLAMVAAGALVIQGCANETGIRTVGQTQSGAVEAEKFAQDRKAILAMAGDYHVTFDFRETVALTPGYELKKPKVSGAEEIVRVVEDRGDFISLQQILVMKFGDEVYVTKHWRQDWQYEPASVLVFIGGNAWKTRPVSEAERAGKWSQTVYQVEDSPRYGAVGAWTHTNGVSQWTPPAEIRPLPRRDMTTRKDYDAVLAVNRHTITPFGWVQEEDNSKLVLRGEPHVLAREIGVNTYRRSTEVEKAGDAYWSATGAFWAAIRKEWARLEASAPDGFGLTVQGEPEPLYDPILTLADDVQAGKVTTEAAIAEALKVMARFTTTDIGTLAQRLAQAAPAASASTPAAR